MCSSDPAPNILDSVREVCERGVRSLVTLPGIYFLFQNIFKTKSTFDNVNDIVM